MCVEARGQLTGVSFFLLFCGSWYRAQTPSPTEPSHQAHAVFRNGPYHCAFSPAAHKGPRFSTASWTLHLTRWLVDYCNNHHPNGGERLICISLMMGPGEHYFFIHLLTFTHLPYRNSSSRPSPTFKKLFFPLMLRCLSFLTMKQRPRETEWLNQGHPKKACAFASTANVLFSLQVG